MRGTAQFIISIIFGLDCLLAKKFEWNFSLFFYTQPYKLFKKSLFFEKFSIITVSIARSVRNGDNVPIPIDNKSRFQIN